MVPDLEYQRRFFESVTGIRSISASQTAALETAGLAFQSLLAGVFGEAQ